MHSISQSMPRAGATHLAPGQVLYDAGLHGSVWQLRSGALRLDRVEREGPRFLQLVLPGDLIGLEQLAACPYAHTARAIVPSEVQPCELVGDGGRRIALVEGLLQQQARTADLVALRSGTAQDRLKQLLLLLCAPDGSAATGGAHALPTIKDMAAILDTAPETVSRIFANLKRSQLLEGRQRQGASYCPERLRAQDWPAGLTRSDAHRPTLVAPG